MKIRPGQNLKQADPMPAAMLNHAQPMAIERDFNPHKANLTYHGRFGTGLCESFINRKAVGLRFPFLR